MEVLIYRSFMLFLWSYQSFSFSVWLSWSAQKALLCLRLYTIHRYFPLFPFFGSFTMLSSRPSLIFLVIWSLIQLEFCFEARIKVRIEIKFLPGNWTIVTAHRMNDSSLTCSLETCLKHFSLPSSSGSFPSVHLCFHMPWQCGFHYLGFMIHHLGDLGSVPCSWHHHGTALTVIDCGGLNQWKEYHFTTHPH